MLGPSAESRVAAVAEQPQGPILHFREASLPPPPDAKQFAPARSPPLTPEQ